MAGLRKRVVVKGTLKKREHGTVRFADISLKTADRGLSRRSQRQRPARRRPYPTGRKSAKRTRWSSTEVFETPIAATAEVSPNAAAGEPVSAVEGSRPSAGSSWSETGIESVVTEGVGSSRKISSGRKALQVMGRTAQVAGRTAHVVGRTAQVAVRSQKVLLQEAEQSQPFSDGDSRAEEYATERVGKTAAKAIRDTERLGRKAARQSFKELRNGTLSPSYTVNSIKKGSGGLKTSASELRYASQSLSAARRSPQAKAMIRRAQKRSFEASKELVKSAAYLVKTVAKAAGRSIVLVFGGAWVLLLAVLILAGGAFSMINQQNTSTATVPASEASVVCYYFLRSYMGLNSAAACGVMANIEAESGFNVTALGDSGTSYGLCQWHNDRWDRMVDFCNNNGYSSSSLMGQLNYLRWELPNRYPDVWDFLVNVEDDIAGCYDAASYMCVHFEKPTDTEKNAAIRAENSLNYWWQYATEDSTEQGMRLALTAYNELGNYGGDQYISWFGFSEHVNWCAIFVSWCGNQCGYLDAGIMPMSANVEHPHNGYPWYVNYSRLVFSSPDVKPAPGWVAFYSRGHTGIVFACIDDVVWVVEGNAMNAVQLCQYPLSAIRNDISSYGVPRFDH